MSLLDAMLKSGLVSKETHNSVESEKRAKETLIRNLKFKLSKISDKQVKDENDIKEMHSIMVKLGSLTGKK